MEAAIDQLLEWTSSIGIELNGIHPKALHGRGLGIVATRHLEVQYFAFSLNIPLATKLGSISQCTKPTYIESNTQIYHMLTS